MFIREAFAQAAAAPATGSGNIMDSLQQFAPLVLIFVVFYVLLLRPQQKKAKMHKEMISNVRRGDRVVTSGGLLGTVNKVINETEVQVELSENVRVRVLRSAITDILAKTEPVKGSAKAEAAEAADEPQASTTDGEPAKAPLGGFLEKLTGKR